MNANYEVPVIRGGEVSVIEDFINDYFYPFYGLGNGTVLCPVCIIDDKDNPCLLDRLQFVEHFQDRHHKNIDVLGLSFSTRYNSRLMEAFSLYILCRHYANQAEDYEGHPFLLPTKGDRFGHPSIIDMDKSLAPFFRELQRKKKPSKGLKPLRDPPVGSKSVSTESGPSRAKTQVKTESASKKAKPADNHKPDEALLDQSSSESETESSESETEPQDEGQSRP
jgi:hypothetical protein